MSGNAVLKAARELRAQLLPVAARMLGADVAGLEMADDAVLAPGGRSLALPDLLRECARVGVPRSHLAVYHAPAGEPVDLATGSGKVFPDYTYGAHAAEVEVDTETGHVRIVKYAAAHDVGRAINPQSVEGQIQGGAAQGIGWALNEEYVYGADGRLQNPIFLDYRIPVASDLPMIDTVIVEVPNPGHPYGVRGVGETPIVPPLGALHNAIARAAHDVRALLVVHDNEEVRPAASGQTRLAECQDEQRAGDSLHGTSPW